MGKKRKKTRSRKTSYAPRRPKPTTPSQPREERPTPQPAERPRRTAPTRRAGGIARSAYAGRTASHLAAMDLEKDEVMYSYVKKDLMRIGIFSAIMFGTLLVLKLIGVG